MTDNERMRIELERLRIAAKRMVSAAIIARDTVEYTLAVEQLKRYAYAGDRAVIIEAQA